MKIEKMQKSYQNKTKQKLKFQILAQHKINKQENDKKKHKKYKQNTHTYIYV